MPERFLVRIASFWNGRDLLWVDFIIPRSVHRIVGFWSMALLRVVNLPSLLWLAWGIELVCALLLPAIGLVLCIWIGGGLVLASKVGVHCTMGLLPTIPPCWIVQAHILHMGLHAHHIIRIHISERGGVRAQLAVANNDRKKLIFVETHRQWGHLWYE